MHIKHMIRNGAIITALIAIFGATATVNAGIGDLITATLNAEVDPGPPSIRIFLAHDLQEAMIEVKGKYKIYDPKTNEQVSINFVGKRRLMEAEPDGLRWGEEFPGVHQIMIVPDNPEVTIVVNGIEYEGVIYVYDVGGTLSLVNGLDVEDYLNSVLPKRYAANAGLSDEMLASIAIVARTSAYASIKKERNPYWDLDGSKEGYEGHAAPLGNKALAEATRKTKFLVLKEEEDKEAAFSPSWIPAKKRYEGIAYSKISQDEANKMASNGKNAVDILKKAFPTANLGLGYKPLN